MKQSVPTVGSAENPVDSNNNPSQPIISNPEKEKEIFQADKINAIYLSEDPIKETCLLLESNYRKIFQKADFDSSKLMAKAEFYVNVLIFIKETFKFEDEIISKLMNLFSNMINLEEEEEQDYLKLGKKKINEFKKGLMEYKLIPIKEKEIQLSNNPDKVITEGKFFLNIKEINELIAYLKTDYFPYIRMWYLLSKRERNKQDKTVEIVINQPLEILSLSLAEMEEKPMPAESEEKEDKTGNEAENEEKKEIEEKENEVEEKKEEYEETYLDRLNKLGFNEETKKIIIQKVTELQQDVENKINDRQKVLDEKINEIETTVKGPKKK